MRRVCPKTSWAFVVRSRCGLAVSDGGKGTLLEKSDTESSWRCLLRSCQFVHSWSFLSMFSHDVTWSDVC